MTAHDLFSSFIFAQFVNPNYPQPSIPFLILALIIQSLSLIYLTVLIYAGQTLAEGFRKRKKVSSISAGGVELGLWGFSFSQYSVGMHSLVFRFLFCISSPTFVGSFRLLLTVFSLCR